MQYGTPAAYHVKVEAIMESAEEAGLLLCRCEGVRSILPILEKAFPESHLYIMSHTQCAVICDTNAPSFIHAAYELQSNPILQIAWEWCEFPLMWNHMEARLYAQLNRIGQ